MAIDKDLLKGFETMEKLQEDGVIESYSYNSKEGDFTFYANVGGEYGDTREETVNMYEADEETVLSFINEWEREFEKMVQEAEEEERSYQRDREAAYWAVQGVEY